MAKGAAKQEALGGLHSTLTKLFQKTLDNYMLAADKIEELDAAGLEDEMLTELLSKGFEPNPAMLGAITKFLKDNEIAFDDEDVDKLSKTEEALKKRREQRSNVVQLSNLKAVGDE